MTESNGHTALQGLHGRLPSPLCGGSQAVQSVGGFILTPLLLVHMNEKSVLQRNSLLFDVLHADIYMSQIQAHLKVKAAQIL